jgi:hypothetical protein
MVVMNKVAHFMYNNIVQYRGCGHHTPPIEKKLSFGCTTLPSLLLVYYAN